MNKRADPFEWGGGHPALDFVNTLDERPFDRPIENLATDRDLVRFAQLAGLVEPGLADAADSRRACILARCRARAKAAGTFLQCIGGGPQARTGIAKRPGCHCVGRPGGARRPRSHGTVLAESCALPLVSSGDRRNSPARLRACHRKSADRRRSPPTQEVRGFGLRCLLCRPEQRPSSAVVQHEQLRQPRKAASLALRKSGSLIEG